MLESTIKKLERKQEELRQATPEGIDWKFVLSDMILPLGVFGIIIGYYVWHSLFANS